MWQDSEFGTIPLRFIRLGTLIAPKLLDCTYDRRYHQLHFCEKSTETDQYWLTYGSSKFHDEMPSFEASTCRGLKTTELDYFLHIMHIIVGRYTIYNRTTRGADKTLLRCSLSLVMPGCLHNGTCHGWRRWCVVCVVWRITYLYLRQKQVLSDVCDLARVEFFTLRNASLGWIFSDFIMLPRATSVAEVPQPELVYLPYIRSDFIPKSDVLDPHRGES